MDAPHEAGVNQLFDGRKCRSPCRPYPLNEYVLNGKAQADTGGTDRQEIPLFQCPSEEGGDGGSFDQFFSGPNPDDSAYETMGTSYGDIGGLALHAPCTRPA